MILKSGARWNKRGFVTMRLALVYTSLCSISYNQEVQPHTLPCWPIETAVNLGLSISCRSLSPVRTTRPMHITVCSDTEKLSCKVLFLNTVLTIKNKIKLFSLYFSNVMVSRYIIQIKNKKCHNKL